MIQVFACFLLAGVVSGNAAYKNTHFAQGKYGIVHLFEWHWDTIADECETFLGPNKIGGVQISPPTENRIITSRPWWERYQPVSYVLGTRSGDRQALSDMINRCNAVGVRIYADIVVNHMCQPEAQSGNGTAGSFYDAIAESFPAVPYSNLDFNDANCHTSSGLIENYQDPNQVRNCRLNDLLDLNQGKEWVKGRITSLMNDLIDLGVAGFRVDACKHMWPGDLRIIFDNVKNLNENIYGSGKRPFIYQEVIDQGGEPIKASDYTDIAVVTEFKYGKDLAANRMKIQYLGTVGPSWGMLPSHDALVFINNHDNQRGHGGGNNIVAFNNPYDLKILTAYMLAYPYGIPRVMSSYFFQNTDQGPPDNQRSVQPDGSCGNGWVCEHRWRQIKNMFAFAAAVQGTAMDNWWTNGDNRIAFSRGNKGFIAISKSGDMDEILTTGLPDGSYCDVIKGDFDNGLCGGPCVQVTNGKAKIKISASLESDQIVAIHVNAMTELCNA